MLVHRGIQRRRFHAQPELRSEVGAADRVPGCDDHWDGDFRVSCGERISTPRSASFRGFVAKGSHEASVNSAFQVCMYVVMMCL